MRPFSHVYFLLDPQGRVRYVGQAVSPSDRFATHLREAPNRTTHKECWIFGLLCLGLKPILRVVESTDDPNGRERYWIARLISEGCDLTNQTSGGDGGALSLESTAKMAASLRLRYKDPEARKAVSLATSIGMRNAEVAAKVSANARKPERRENCAEVGKANAGRILTQEHRDKIRAGLRRHYGSS